MLVKFSKYYYTREFIFFEIKSYLLNIDILIKMMKFLPKNHHETPGMRLGRPQQTPIWVLSIGKPLLNFGCLCPAKKSAQ